MHSIYFYPGFSLYTGMNLLHLIQFHVVGYSPDGDSLMFEAANAKQWDKIQSQFRETFMEKLKGNKSVQLRLQGVDALETHYSPSKVPAPKELSGKSHSRMGEQMGCPLD